MKNLIPRFLIQAGPALGLCLLGMFPFALTAQWQVINSGVTKDLLDIYFLDQAYGVVVGEEGTVLRTTDGGQHWEPIQIGLEDDFRSVVVLGPDTILIAGDTPFDGKVYLTTDGGAEWRQVTTGSEVARAGERLLAMDFQTIRLSQTGESQTWLPANILIGSTTTLRQLLFVDDAVGHALGNVAGFATYSIYGYSSNDGGQSWKEWYVFDLPNADAWTTAAAPARDTVFLFTNTYVNFSPGPENHLVRLTDFYFDPTPGINGWRFQSVVVREEMPAFINAAYFLSSKTGYAAADNGSIYLSTNGGMDWTADYSGDEALQGLFFIDDQTAFAVGDDGLILRKDLLNPVVEPVRPLPLTVFPNPAGDWIQIMTPACTEADLRILGPDGRAIRHLIYYPGQPVSTAGLAPGGYVIEISDGKQRYVGKLLKH